MPFRVIAFYVVLTVLFSACQSSENKTVQRAELAQEIEQSLQRQLLDLWYPQCIDSVHGGYFCTYTFDFKPTGPQNKMIVTQARHVWTTAKASMAYPEVDYYRNASSHGVDFLRNVMWDETYGGFHTLVDRRGKVISAPGEEKTAYGNAFGIYALAAYVMATQDTSALALARKAFMWMEEHSHDPVHKGYFQHLKRDGSVIERAATTPSSENLGYKDQNSSIHLLEAFTELYQVWPHPLVLERLKEMLFLIRDTITHEKGYLILFFQPDWTPVSFRDSSEEVIMRHLSLDHVSFGHDVETAYLLLEASHVAGLEKDSVTLRSAKKMVDHALMNGWDHTRGGFYDEGYYFRDREEITIVRGTKNWWAQAEGLNTILLMADLFPDDHRYRYFERFREMWDYIDKNLIDHEHGEWYSGGIDEQPELKTALKGHNWKAFYHQYRSMENCIKRLRR